VQSIDEYVYLFVCQLAKLENHTAEHHQMFVHVAYGRCSVILRRRCDTLCTSGFVDDVMFSHNGFQARQVYSYAAIEYRYAKQPKFPSNFCSTIKTGSTDCELLTEGEVCYNCLVYL